MSLTHFSLCTGGGGLDMAAEMAGFETVGQCEIDPYCNMILELRYPNMPYWEDINHVTARKFSKKTGIASGELTIMSAGIPCQPHSVAGARKGSADSRDLKEPFLRCVRGIRPKWVLVENVFGILSTDAGRYFGDFLRRLDGLGYDAGWCSYAAAGVGAKHNRKRVGIVAYRRDDGRLHRPHEINAAETGQRAQPDAIMCGEVMADAKDENSRGMPIGEKTAGRFTGSSFMEYAEFNGLQKQGFRGIQGGSAENVANRSPRSTESGLGGTFNGLADWLDSIGWIADKGEAKKGIAYPWEPPRTAPGVANRAKRIKMIGNGVVPQWAYPILKAIAEIENELDSQTIP